MPESAVTMCAMAHSGGAVRIHCHGDRIVHEPDRDGRWV